MKISPTSIDLILQIFQILIIPLAGMLMRQIYGLRKDIIELEKRVQDNEQKLDCQPDTKALHELALSVERLRGEISSISQEVIGMHNLFTRLDTIVERQEQYLLNGGTK